MNVDQEYIRSRVDVTDAGCWEWSLSRYPTGYGSCVMRLGGGYSHRASYEAFVGPIPAGLQIDHLCRNRACCNPEHLEPVTGRENIMRSPVAVAALNSVKTHCKRGHEFTDENTLVRRGGRACRTCMRALQKQWEARHPDRRRSRAADEIAPVAS